MKFTVSTAVENMVRRDLEVEFRLEAQAEALAENKCVDITIGQWVNDLEYLYAVLDLPEVEFAKRFPSVVHITYDRRQQIKARIGWHLSHCTHCTLKYGFELELDARIMRTCKENRGELLRLLNEGDTDLAEGDHQIVETWAVISKHQFDIQRGCEIVIDPLIEPV